MRKILTSLFKKRKAVVLLSGGLDSMTCLAMAKKQGFACYALSFDYGQRHKVELDAARVVTKQLGVKEHRTVNIDINQFGGSALTDTSLDVPTQVTDGIPITYVPARNTIFLSIALGWAEVLGAEAIFIGINSVDYSGYPDCRPEYINAFQTMANLATKAGVEGEIIKIETPLVDMTKSDIIRHGTQLGLDYSKTVSCYNPDEQGRACGVCDSCHLRKMGFGTAQLSDPTRYQSDV